MCILILIRNSLFYFLFSFHFCFFIFYFLIFIFSRKIKHVICIIGKNVLMAGGMNITIKGRQASKTEAPILVAAPHSTFIDAGIVYLTGFPSTICRRESAGNNHIGSRFLFFFIILLFYFLSFLKFYYFKFIFLSFIF